MKNYIKNNIKKYILWFFVGSCIIVIIPLIYFYTTINSEYPNYINQCITVSLKSTITKYDNDISIPNNDKVKNTLKKIWINTI